MFRAGNGSPLFRLAGLAAHGLGVVSTRITPGVQRLLDRLARTPVCARRRVEPHRGKRITELRAARPRFVELGQSADLPGSREQSRPKIVGQHQVGRITLDCDVLIVGGDDLRITVYTAQPGSEDAGKLDLAIVLGTQTRTG